TAETSSFDGRVSGRPVSWVCYPWSEAADPGSIRVRIPRRRRVSEPGGRMPDDARLLPQPASPRRPRISRAHAALFSISFGILFFELACIRWFGSTVVFLTFFTNIVLLACVLGMSAGCLAAARRFDYLDALIPLTLVTVTLGQGLLWGYNQERVAIR